MLHSSLPPKSLPSFHVSLGEPGLCCWEVLVGFHPLTHKQGTNSCQGFMAASHQFCFLLLELLQQVSSSPEGKILCFQEKKNECPLHTLASATQSLSLFLSPAQFREGHFNTYARGFPASGAKQPHILDPPPEKALATYTKDLSGKQKRRGCCNAGSWHAQPFTYLPIAEQMRAYERSMFAAVCLNPLNGNSNLSAWSRLCALTPQDYSTKLPTSISCVYGQINRN